MKTYKMILGTFFLVATLIITLMAVLVVLDITTIEKAASDTATLGMLLGIIALASSAIVVVLRSVANLK